jgi:XRE family aerobic/anaerobic benzoate catabolism transcriptional regulator
MTRKALAHLAGVSERHLANLETGQGNASVMLLRQLARALGATIGELVGEGVAGSTRASRDPDRTGRVALIGLRGAGKSTLGRMLADDLTIPFIELDRVVERIAGCDVGEIHSLYGAAAFRRYELRALEETIADHRHAVIATGGGLVNEPDTYALLRARCFTVWLRATPDEHMKRVIAQGDMRPMAGNAEAMDDLKRILAGREAAYARADLIFDTSGKPLAEAYLALRSQVMPRLAAAVEMNSTA